MKQVRKLSKLVVKTQVQAGKNMPLESMFASCVHTKDLHSIANTDI